MEKEKKGAAAFALAIAGALLLILGAGIAFASQGGTASLAGSKGALCDTFPTLTLEKGAVASEPGRVAAIKISVTGTQPQSCGTMQYGMDFTNGYDGREFVLAISGSQERNLFFLQPGETKTFEGLVGIPPSTLERNYTLQIVAYPEGDHWKQASGLLGISTGRQDDSDAYWATELQIGWNLIPNIEGLGVYGCPDINTAYRYSAQKGEYLVLNRYGAVFEVAPFEPKVENENYGGLFVFSRSRCAMESRVPSYLLEGARVSLRGGQLLSVPPAWHDEGADALAKQCMGQSKNPSDSLEMKGWNAENQRWEELSPGRTLKNGEVLRLLANFDCTLQLDMPLAGQGVS